MLFCRHNGEGCVMYDRLIIIFRTYEVLSESSQTVTVVTASMKEDERGGPKSHFPKATASVCHMTLRCEHALFLHKCFFNFVFPFSCNGWQN
jgi:hypothetical protein